MGAYSYLETDEFTGGIVFANSNIEARRIGSNLLDRDEIGGMAVNRRKDLDKYEQTGVPAWLLISQGWHFECFGCGMRIDDCGLEDAHLPVTGVVGKESGNVYCCHTCRMESLARDAAIKAYGEAFLEMLRDMVRDKFPGIEHAFGEHKAHVYIPRHQGGFSVAEAEVRFNFPGMKIGPAALSYRWSTYANIGPVRPEFWCCNGDRQAFEAFAAEAKRTKA